jgi:hypothetical protein
MSFETAFLLLLANFHLISAVPIARARNKHFEDAYKMPPVIVTPDSSSGATPALPFKGPTCTIVHGRKRGPKGQRVL